MLANPSGTIPHCGGCHTALNACILPAEDLRGDGREGGGGENKPHPWIQKTKTKKVFVLCDILCPNSDEYKHGFAVP